MSSVPASGADRRRYRRVLIHRLTAALLPKLRYFRVMSVYAVERFTYLVLSFLVFPIIAKAYGPDALGHYSIAQTVVSLVTPFLATGAEAIAIRDLVRRGEERGKVAGSAALLLGLFTVPAVLLPIGAAYVAYGDDPVTVTLVIWLAIAFLPTPLYVIDFLWKADLRPAYSVVPRLLVMLVSLAAKATAARSGYPIIAIAVITAAEAWISALMLAVVFLFARRRGERWTLEREAFRSLFAQTLPAMIAMLAVLVFFRVTQLMLGWLSNYREVGIYAVAFQLIQVPNILPTVVLTTCYPRLVALRDENPALYTEYLDRLLSFFSFAGWGLVLVVLLGGDWGMNLLFGNKFQGSGLILLLLSISTLCNFSAAVRGQLIFIANRPNLHVANALIGLATLIPLNFALIPHYGAQGGAAAVAVASLVSGVLTSFLFSETSPFGRRQLWRLVLPSALFWRLST